MSILHWTQLDLLAILLPHPLHNYVRVKSARLPLEISEYLQISSTGDHKVMKLEEVIALEDLLIQTLPTTQ